MNDHAASPQIDDETERLQRSGWTVDASAAAAKIAALAALSELPPPEPVASVQYVSRGCVLVIGADAGGEAAALRAAAALSGGLDVHVLLGSAPAAQSEDWLAWDGSVQAIAGYLGAFDVRWRRRGDQAASAAGKSESIVVANAGEVAVVTFDAARGEFNGRFDLVLDFSDPPLFAMAQPPQGYFAARDLCDDPVRLAAIYAELADSVGEFEKPRFFAYKEKICAHSRSQKDGCNKCIDVCSTRAIAPDGDRVKVDPHLCMGCGACASVCPSGAMTFQYPRVAERGAQVKALLQAFRKAGGADACLLFHNGLDGRELLAEASRAGQGLPANVIPVETWHVASTGIDLLLGAVCYGAPRVVLLSAGSEAPQYAAALRTEMDYAQKILAALGYGDGHFSWVAAATPAALGAALAGTLDGIAPGAVPAVAATFNLSNDKRGTLEFAIEHLLKHARAHPQEIALPAGAPFGRVNVDTAKCTMCLACAGACPESALMDAQDYPRLKFVERNCVQCGICASTCPEDAISLTPRLLLTPQWKQEVVLNEAEPFDCISCGKPLGTKQMIDSMLGKLAGHSMFADAGKLKRLQMCADCRVVDMMSNPHEMSVLTGKRIA